MMNKAETLEIEGQVSERELKQLEEQKLSDLLAERKIDPLSPHRTYCITPAEHSLIGSSWPGLIFSPQMTSAERTNVSLDAINKSREADSKVIFHTSYGDVILEVTARLLPLSDDLERRNNSFEITNYKVLKGLMPENINDGLIQSCLDETLRRSRDNRRRVYAEEILEKGSG